MRWARYEQMHVVLADVTLDDLTSLDRYPHNLPQTDATSAAATFCGFVIHTKWYFRSNRVCDVLR